MTQFTLTLWMEMPIDHPIAKGRDGEDTYLIIKKRKQDG